MIPSTRELTEANREFFYRKDGEFQNLTKGEILQYSKRKQAKALFGFIFLKSINDFLKQSSSWEHVKDWMVNQIRFPLFLIPNCFIISQEYSSIGSCEKESLAKERTGFAKNMHDKRMLNTNESDFFILKRNLLTFSTKYSKF